MDTDQKTPLVTECAAVAQAHGINFARIVQLTVALTNVLEAAQLTNNERASVSLSLYLGASVRAVQCDQDLEVFRAVTKAVRERWEHLGAATTVADFRARLEAQADPLAAFRHMPADKVG